MSYALDITEFATDDLVTLLDSLPLTRRSEAFEAVWRELNGLAENPLEVPRVVSDRPTHLFSFIAEGVHYFWGATFRFSEDEKLVVITHVFRLAL